MSSIPKLRAIAQDLHAKSGDKNVEKKVHACIDILNRYCLLKREPTTKQTEACTYAASILILSPGKVCGPLLVELLAVIPLGVVTGTCRSLPENARNLLMGKVQIWETQGI